MKKNLINILNFKQFKIVLLLEGLLVGIISGLVIVGYRICLSNEFVLVMEHHYYSKFYHFVSNHFLPLYYGLLY